MVMGVWLLCWIDVWVVGFFTWGMVWLGKRWFNLTVT